MIIADVIEDRSNIQTLDVCLSSAQTVPCEKTWKIRVKKCFDFTLNEEFNLYELIPTEGCPQSYCIGKNNSCTKTCLCRMVFLSLLPTTGPVTDFLWWYLYAFPFCLTTCKVYITHSVCLYVSLLVYNITQKLLYRWL